MNMITRSSFGFIGFGLIGGSLAKVIQQQNPHAHIMAYNYRTPQKNPHLEQALQDHVLSKISESLADFSTCEVIFLCAPVKTNIRYLKKIVSFLSPTCIVTDVGSVKSDIYLAAQQCNIDQQFIGGHPMTGSEKTSYEHSDAHLLEGATYVLTPGDHVSSEQMLWMTDFIRQIGAKPLILPPDEHDHIVAAISHGPHILSAVLSHTVADLEHHDLYTKLAAGAFRDMTRISSSSPQMWQDIFLNNRKCILEFLELYMTSLKTLMSYIDDQDEDAMMHFWGEAKAYHDDYLHKKEGGK